eukprot:scaffold400220_cov20-Prasinocladus_malaysianus.AAC.1
MGLTSKALREEATGLRESERGLQAPQGQDEAGHTMSHLDSALAAAGEVQQVERLHLKAGRIRMPGQAARLE